MEMKINSKIAFAEKDDARKLVRVIAVDRDQYVIGTGRQEIRAEMTGRLRFSAHSPLDYPKDLCF